MVAVSGWFPAHALLVLLVLAVLAAHAAPSGERELQDYGLALTPFGYWPAACVHAAPNGAHVETTAKGLVRIVHPDGSEHHHQPCASRYSPSRLQELKQHAQAKRGQGNGWQVYTLQQFSNNVTSLLGQWPVPPAPENFDQQTVFLFTGMQNINWIPPQPHPGTPFDIIQPVLQYGPSAAGGWDYWAIASWYVTLTDDVVYSEIQTVQSGDVIFGNMTKVGADAWYINTVDVTSQINSAITVSRPILATQPWIYVTLEAYGIYDCSLLPTGTVPFTKLQLTVERDLTTPKWVTGNQNPFCPTTIKVTDPSTVVIGFQ